MSSRFAKYNMCKGIINATNGGVASNTDNNSKYNIIFALTVIMLTAVAVIKLLKGF